jgi:enoyl-[acyl-carrier-protein] reductase (NADH)
MTATQARATTAGDKLLVNDAGITADRTVLKTADEDWVLDGLRAKIPLGRLGQPGEIARVVHFLAADASAYITGQIWGVNGGLDM